ncbi:MAG TPA: PQQ-binding-like beta-propeller repeat protein [Phycisphaerae bacterium]|nr:PQQ-binding-like beta-propeller repeat protein [Phycisphaerae bacterium]
MQPAKHPFTRTLGGVTLAMACLFYIGGAPAQPPAGPTRAFKLDYARLFPDHVAVLQSQSAVGQNGADDALLTYSDGRIERIDPKTGRSLWPQGFHCGQQPAWLGSDARRFYFAGADRIFALSRESGEARLDFTLSTADDPASDPEQFETWTHHVYNGQAIFAASDRGNIICLTGKSNQPRWQQRIKQGAVRELTADDSRVYLGVRNGAFWAIHVLDRATGAVRREIPARPGDGIREVRAAPRGNLLIVTAGRMYGLDPARDENLWTRKIQGHALASTLLQCRDRFSVSDDGKSVAMFDSTTGEELWRTPAVIESANDTLWTAEAAGRFVVVSRDKMSVYRGADGRRIRSAALPAAPRAQPPVMTRDSILTIAAEPSAATSTNGSNKTARGKTYQIRCFSIIDGKPRQLTRDGHLRTEPLERFGGMFVRQGAIVIVDGDRLIGYVEID